MSKKLFIPTVRVISEKPEAMRFTIVHADAKAKKPNAMHVISTIDDVPYTIAVEDLPGDVRAKVEAAFAAFHEHALALFDDHDDDKVKELVAMSVEAREAEKAKAAAAAAELAKAAKADKK